MLLNYWKAAFRNLLRNRVQTVINVIGLATGLSASILVLLYVQSERNYDRHHTDGDRIFRLISETSLNGQSDLLARNSMRTGPEFLTYFPEVEAYTRLMEIGRQTIWYEDKMFNETTVSFVDSNFFQFFNYEFIAGNPRSALNAPYRIAISESKANKYFGSASAAMGKSLQFTLRAYEVTGVFKDPKAETHIPADMFISLSSFNRQTYNQALTDYFRMMNFTYLKLKPGVEPANFEPKFASFYKDHTEPWVKENNVQGYIHFFLQPLADIHLNNSLSYDYSTVSNKSYVYIFTIVGFFILLIGCINYMNLATAKSMSRAREVGVRKVAGATRFQLMAQLLAETFLLTFIAFILALGLVELLLPYFNELADKQFSFSALFVPRHLLALLLLWITVSLLAGFYPAFYLTRFNPAIVLRASAGSGNGIPSRWGLFSNMGLRKVLVIIQFTISILLITGTLVVMSQLDYMRNKDLGFRKEQIYVIQIPGDTVLFANLPTVKEELKRIPGVMEIATSSNVIGKPYGKLYFLSEKNGSMMNNFLGMTWIDADYLQLMDMKVVKGRGFDQNRPSDEQSAFLINEKAASFLGWADPIGKRMENGFGMQGEVIGVIKDFNYTSLHNPVEPLVLMFSRDPLNQLYIRVQPENMQETIEKINARWQQFDNRHPLESFFLDEDINSSYRKESRMLQIFGYFAGLTIIISCLGLFGLASFTAEMRTKEIGIRKVLGGTEWSIVQLLVKDFAILVLIAMVPAFGLAAWAFDDWLQQFAYHIQLSAGPFLWSGIAALLVAIVTVSFLAWRAARRNPVQSLRYE